MGRERPRPSITTEDQTRCHQPGKRSKFKIRSTESTEGVMLLHIVKSKARESRTRREAKTVHCDRIPEHLQGSHGRGRTLLVSSKSEIPMGH